MKIHFHVNDLEEDIDFGDCVAIDTETMGLNLHRDRLCLIQLSAGDGNCHLVQFTPEGKYNAPRLKKVLSDPNITKLFHFARFDYAALYHYLGVECAPLYCTKIASRLTRTYTDRHSLKDLCASLLGIEIFKEARASDWGAENLTIDQIEYAKDDVLYLHKIKESLDEMLVRQGRVDLAQKCFEFVPTCSKLDLQGWDPATILNH
jgi:ribonuclease D